MEEQQSGLAQTLTPVFVLTDKNRTRFFIRYFDNEKFEDTAGEVAWDAFAQERGVLSEKVATFPTKVSTEYVSMRYDLTPDRFTKRFGFVEIDGVVHDTPRQESKTRWRDAAITAYTNKRIIHIPDELLVKKVWWDYVAYRLWLWNHSIDWSGKMPL